MTKSAVVASLLAFVMMIGVADTTIATAGGFDWSKLTVDESSASVESSASTNGTQEKKGNSFVRALGAPFRAFGRLFGGNKKNAQETSRISQKEASKFESTKLTRVKGGLNNPEISSSADVLPTSSGEAHLQNGRALITSGDVNGAISELSIAASSDSKSGEPQNLLGVAFEMKGLRERALESFKFAVQAKENNPEFLNNYGYLLYKNNDFESATKYLKRAAKFSRNDARIWNNLAMAQCGRRKFDDAYASFVKAVGEFGAHTNIAYQLQRYGYAKEAIKQLEQAQALQPNSVEVLTKLVSLYETTGRPTDAETTRRSLLALKTFADVNK